MAWQELIEPDDINTLRDASYKRPQLIFKHSTRCGISMGAMHRMDEGLESLSGVFDLHYLDLLNHRAISNLIADTFEGRHHSPQVIVVDKGKAAFHASHGVISPEFILKNYPN